MTDYKDINNENEEEINSEESNTSLDLNQEELGNAIHKGIDDLIKSGYFNDILKYKSYNKFLNSVDIKNLLEYNLEKSDDFNQFINNIENSISLEEKEMQIKAKQKNIEKENEHIRMMQKENNRHNEIMLAIGGGLFLLGLYYLSNDKK